MRLASGITRIERSECGCGDSHDGGPGGRRDVAGADGSVSRHTPIHQGRQPRPRVIHEMFVNTLQMSSGSYGVATEAANAAAAIRQRSHWRMDFGALPEVTWWMPVLLGTNGLRRRPGTGWLRSWSSAATGYETVITQLSSEGWLQGPASAAMAGGACAVCGVMSAAAPTGGHTGQGRRGQL